MSKLDYIPRTNIKMIHVDKSYSFGVDSIILGDFARMKSNKVALDIGAGSGVLSFLINSRYKLEKVFAVEIQKEKAKLLEENIKLNGIKNIELINEDLNKITIKENSIDYIITKDEEFLISRQEKFLKLSDIFSFANKALKDKGKLFMIHKPERMVDIFNQSGNLKAKTVRFVHSQALKKPQFILIEFVKNARDGLRIEDPLIIYDKEGYSEEMKIINDLD